MTKRLWLVVLVLSLFSNSACRRLEDRADLPAPDRACASEDAAIWNGLTPGEATRADVRTVLGEPETADTQRFNYPSTWDASYYGYPVEGGTIAQSEFGSYKAYFRDDGVVDWIEVPLGDKDGKYHSVQEVADDLGHTVDAIHLNRSFDVVGPDEVIVWSECGVALVILNTCVPGMADLSVTCHAPPHWLASTSVSTETLVVRQVLEGRSLVPSANQDTNGAILLKVLFPPTTFDGYIEYIMPVVPSAHHYYLGSR